MYRKEKYINPFTDYGFKRLFGEEPNKDLLLDFLNELLREEEGEIAEISYLPNENLPIHLGDRKAIFDIYCTNKKGENFIVEMQKAEQKYFKDRTVFYSTFPIQQQARDKGSDWNFKLKSVYTIGILNFEFKESDPDKYRHDVKLTEQETKKLFYDKLTYIYLEMPKFNKTEDELETRFDKWLYVLKNLPKLDRVPVSIKEKIFLKLFETAAIARMSPQEYNKYEVSLNSYRDVQNIKNTHYEKGMIKGEEKGRKEGLKEGKKEGRKEGRKEGIAMGKQEEKTEIAKSLLEDGMPINLISKYTGLSEEEINQLKD